MSEIPTYRLRYLSGDRKINAIKLMRQVTGVGLAEAKDIVEQQQVFARGLEHDAAAQIVARFVSEAGSEVELIEEAEHLYAFDPRHPQRGDQPLARLRWHGLALACERGQLGEWTREHEERFADAAARDRAIADERERWAEQGLETAADELDIVRRTSAREPRLEQAIRESDWADDAATVYADWLQRQGDPRGLVAALDLARARAPEQRDELERAIADALQQHRAHLFGPLHGFETGVRFRWWAGQVIGIEIDAHGRKRKPLPIGDDELVTTLLSLPICACLRSLRVSSTAAAAADFASLLANADPLLLAGLRELALTPAYPSVSFSAWDLTPALERLELFGATIPPIQLARLRELELTLWRPETASEALREGGLPSLRSLTLHFNSEFLHSDEWIDVPLRGGLNDLLALPIIASLETFALTSEGDPWPLWIVDALLGARGLSTIERVDLRGVSFEDDALARLGEAHEQRPNWQLPTR